MPNSFGHRMIRRVDLWQQARIPEQDEWGDTLISVVIPVYETNPYLLDVCIRSVLRQIYPHWELIIADDASRSIEVHRVLDQVEKSLDAHSQRIVIAREETNLGLGGNLTRALKHVKGEWIALLDHDDVLLSTALVDVMVSLREAKDRDPKILYTDQLALNSVRNEWHYEDTASGHALKVPFDELRFLQTQYLNHLTCVKTDFAEEIGAWRMDYDGSQDYEFLLRAIRHLENPNDQVVYCPHPAYVWRHQVGQFSANHERVTLCNLRALTALREHARAREMSMDVLPGRALGLYRLRRHLSPETAVAPVTVIVPCPGNVELLYGCLRRLATTFATPLTTLVLASGEDKGRITEAFYEEAPATFLGQLDLRVVRYQQGDRFNFSYTCNVGAKEAETEYIMFLNNDVSLSRGWQYEMLGWLQDTDVGVVGMELRSPDSGLINHGGIALEGGYPVQMWRGLSPGDLRTCFTCDMLAVTGAAMMTKKSLFFDCGGFDEGYVQLYQDVAYCLRVKEKGLRVIYTPYAQGTHSERKSFGGPPDTDIVMRDAKRLQEQFDVRQLTLDDVHSRMLLRNTLWMERYAW